MVVYTLLGDSGNWLKSEPHSPLTTICQRCRPLILLIGAGDGRYLAIASVINLVVMAPWMLLVGWAHTAGWIAPEWSLVAVWSCFGVVYMAMRALTLGLRARGTAWLRTAV